MFGILSRKVSGVYQIVNTINGHRYIGSAANLSSRWRKHRSELQRGVHKNDHLQAAWNKYGEDHFTFEVIEYVEKERLIDVEQAYLDNWQPEYNISKVASSQLGYRHTPEARALIASASLGRTHTHESRMKMSAALHGNKHFLGRTHTAESRAKIGSAQRGKIVTAETRAKQSKTRKGREPHNRRVTDTEIVAFFDANPGASGADAARFFGVTKCTINQRRANLKSKKKKGVFQLLLGFMEDKD